MKMMWDNVLIKPLASKSKLIIGDEQARIPTKGEVIASGPGDWYGYPEFVPTRIEYGNKVYFSKDRAMKIELKNEEYFVVRSRDILGVLEKDDLD